MVGYLVCVGILRLNRAYLLGESLEKPCAALVLLFHVFQEGLNTLLGKLISDDAHGSDFELLLVLC